MTPDEIQAALQVAFQQCERANVALTPQQQQILRQALGLQEKEENPLSQLTAEERLAFLGFVQEEETQKRSWKTTLFNDWLQGRNSGKVQFIRDRYGMQWLEQVQAIHLTDYLHELEDESLCPLKVGDRIEVCNGLWEWVQDSGPCRREWFPCRVIGVQIANDSEDGVRAHASCVVRFDSGVEYEIQGIYEWNRPNWRWV